MIRLVLFLTVLDIFNDESVNQHLEIKNGRTKMADRKLNLNLNLGEIQYM